MIGERVIKLYQQKKVITMENINLIQIISAVFIGFITAWINNIWVQPLVKYRNLKATIVAKMTYFADVYEDDTTKSLKENFSDNPEVKELLEDEKSRMKDKRLEFRSLAGEIKGTFILLPLFYRIYKGNDFGKKIEGELIGLSKSFDHSDIRMRRIKILVLLKVPRWRKIKKASKNKWKSDVF